jgi:hypothetical protein
MPTNGSILGYPENLVILTIFRWSPCYNWILLYNVFLELLIFCLERERDPVHQWVIGGR